MLSKSPNQKHVGKKRLRSKTEKEIWVADSETLPFKYRRIPLPFIWGAYNGREYHEFKTAAEFVEFFRERDCIVYAHNGGKFDWLFLSPYFEQFDPIMVIAGRLAKFRIGQCEFRDSYNILPIPLAQYKKDDIDYAIFEASERDKPKNNRLIRDYLRSDCIYLYEIVTRFIADYGTSLTLAGAALKYWGKMSKRTTPRTPKHFYDKISPFYYGGRVECFYKGPVNHFFKVIDINSAYPYAMTFSHPYGQDIISRPSLPRTRAHTERAFIEVSGISRGALPYRDPNDKQHRLTFPNDGVRRTYKITGWEFYAAIETRTLEKWKILRVWTLADSINFTPYIDHFYAMKAEAEKGSPEYIFAKLFQNSLYGKYAADPEEYEQYEFIPPNCVEASKADWYAKRPEIEAGKGREFICQIGGNALMAEPLPPEKQHFINVAVAASITGFVRAYLWRAIKQCKNVLYCDTDSIACEAFGDVEIDPKKLGAWDLEAECDYGGIAGKKLYAFHLANPISKDGKLIEWKKACKGVKLTAQEIMRVAQGEKITYFPEAPNFSIKQGIQIYGPKSLDEKNLDKMFAKREVQLR